MGNANMMFAPSIARALRRTVPLASQLSFQQTRLFATVFTDQHEWVTTHGDDVVSCGITDFAQNQLGNVVYVELPEVGDVFEQGDAIGVVESVKAASDVYAPVSGEVIEINEELPDEPSAINTDPAGAGWWIKMKLSKPEEMDDLLDEDSKPILRSLPKHLILLR